MKRFCFLLLIAFSVSILAEVVVKNSAPFAFPVTVGVENGKWVKANEVSFAAKSRSGMMMFSWTAPVKAKQGSIAIFTLSGVLVKKVPVNSPCGSIAVSGNKKITSGMYFAKFSYGSFEKTSNFIVY